MAFIQPEAETLDFSTHALRDIFEKSFHHMNTNKVGNVKQSGNDVEGYRSQNVLFQPSVRVFLQYSVKAFNVIDWKFNLTRDLNKDTVVAAVTHHK